MTVNVTKPAINLRSELADLRKPTGIAGEAMLRAETPQEQFNLIGAGRRNIIINGGFQVWQRGTSFTVGNNSVTYTSDRWAAYSNGSSARTVTKEEAVIDGVVCDSIKLAVTSPVNNDRELRHKIEDLKRFSGQTLTLSYDAKASIATAFQIETRREYGVGGSALVDTVEATQTFTTAWQKFTVTFTVPDITGATFGTGSSLDIMFKLNTLQTHDVHLANVQLELGKVATPFEHRSYGEELAACQRYLYAINAKGHPSSTSAAYARFISFAQGANGVIWFPQYPVQMRALPSLIATNVTSSTFQMFNYNAQASASLTGVSLTEGTQTTGQVVFTAASGISAGDIVSLRWNLSPNASFQFDAEL